MKKNAGGTAAASKASRRKAGHATGRPSDRGEFSIDELARAGGSTVRNVRAYQDRGLLPPPVRRGRRGIYTQAHLARLRLVGRMLERGYSLANIAELVATWEQGRDLRQLLGLETELTRPWSDEVPITISQAELIRAFGGSFRPADLAKAVELGIVEPDGPGFRVPSPKMLEVGSAITAMGMSMGELLDLVGGLRRNVERVADELIQVIVKSIDRYGEGVLPPAEDVPRLAALVGRLRPLADRAIESEVSRALERALSRFLGERLGQVLEHIHRVREAP